MGIRCPETKKGFFFKERGNAYERDRARGLRGTRRPSEKKGEYPVFERGFSGENLNHIKKTGEETA